MISVVTVTYNAATALSTTAESVLHQSYSDIEYIIVDGGSTDGTIDIIKSMAHDTRVRYVSEKDNGIFDAMNKGTHMAQGEWIIFMNAGDTFANHDVIRDVFQDRQYSEVDIIYGDVIKEGKVKQAEPPHNSHRMFFCHQSCFTRRTCLMRFPFDINHRMSADIKFVKQAYLAGCKFQQLNMPIAIFDTTGVSNVNRSRGLLDNIRVVREVDTLSEQFRLLPHLLLPYIICKIRNK